jgi:hypothetical protein
MSPREGERYQVSSRNNPIGSQMRGSLKRRLRQQKRHQRRANRICDAAMENKMATAEPNARY